MSYPTNNVGVVTGLIFPKQSQRKASVKVLFSRGVFAFWSTQPYFLPCVVLGVGCFDERHSGSGTGVGSGGGGAHEASHGVSPGSGGLRKKQNTDTR